MNTSATMTRPDFRIYVLSELERICPNLANISKKMSNEKDINHYNPTHPGAWANLGSSIHASAELSRLAVQIAVENPQKIRLLSVPDQTDKTRLSFQVKAISNMARRVDQDILTLANKWSLADFIRGRCSHIAQVNETIAEVDIPVDVDDAEDL